MQYQKPEGFSHDQQDKVGVLITNLGTPDAPDTPSLRRYLKQFLSDPRVVEVPRLIWWFVLHLIILRIRPKRSAHAYQQVWTEHGSPLALHTRAQASKLRHLLQNQWGHNLVVDYAMRYGNPSMDSVISKMLDQGVRKLVVLPMYPQYSGSTTGSTFDALAADFTRRRWIPELRFINNYADFDGYIDALAQSIQAHWANHGRAEKLIFSYHGVPVRYLHNGDPYHCQCLKTSRLLADKLGLHEGQYMTTFQSRFGREPWLQPYTDETLKALPGQGIKSVQVVCPGFSADCLETIEEIGMENRGYFMEAGGERYEYIPALNDQPQHIEALGKLINQHLSGWEIPQTDTAARQQRYSACPHNRK